MPNPTKNEKIDDALNVIFQQLNTLGDSSMGETLADHLQSEHRTLQQSFFRELYKALEIYQDSHYDLRNEASVKFAKAVIQQDHYFPFV